VSCENPELADLPRHLLGNTLIVRDLATARTIWETTQGNGQRTATYRFVTLQGELLEPDGTLTVGTHHAEAGILSRKSELRELRKQAAELDRLIAEVERDLAGLREHVVALDGRIESLQETIDAVTEAEADLRTRVERHRQRRENLHEEVELSRREISGLEEDIRGLEESWQKARAQAEAAEQQVQALQTRMEQAEREIRTLDHQTQRSQQDYTSAKEALARVEERLTALRNQHRQIEGDLQQRRQEQGQGEEHMRAAQARLQESQRILLQASAALAQLYLEKEAAERQVADLAQQREEQRRQRQLLAEQTQTIRNDYMAQQEQVHALDMRVNDLRHLREALSGRLREDYQVELAELYQQAVSSGQWTLGGPAIPATEPGAAPAASPAPHMPTTQEANDEINELKRKLSRLGSVNLDSLQELAELEARAQSLQTQWDDLTAAQRSLQEIIAKINQDSRRLFTETFSTIRLHFQELFRKLFGGGMADIVLEDESDILESGIEIIARPPGKELRSISLMSGGEKTMTAVALLLAIFRSKPSPFCILDEVDAALDEANIDRFTAVLRDFLDRSQFILITHSKKTMACADVLYGITMQESGISKRVAVRFEDWPDDGKPTPPAPVSNGEERSFAGR
jgi:chromosome segregation protein